MIQKISHFTSGDGNNIIPVQPEDILSESQNMTTLSGNIKAKKGSVAAFFKNIELLEKKNISPKQKKDIIAVMNKLAPVLIALGFDKYVVFKNPEVQKIIDDAVSAKK